MSSRSARLPLALAVLAMAWLLVQGVAGAGEGLAMLAPALLLLVPLLAGRYLGEDAIERVRVAGRPPRRARRTVVRSARPRPAAALIARGGLLLASRLAKRPPPALALTR